MNNIDQAQAQEETVKPATDRQIDFLVQRARMPREEATVLSAKEAFNHIAGFIKRRRDAGRQPPTESQLRFLEDHGFNRAAYRLRTRGYCSRLIYRIKAGKVAA